jgi:hypothetical protein
VTTKDLQNAAVRRRRGQRPGMGVDPEPAHDAARTTPDPHEPERLLERRCRTQTAVAILR